MTLENLASLLEMPTPKLVQFSRQAHRGYYPKPLKKKSGETRMTWAPHRELKGAQRALCAKVLNSVPIHAALYGGPKTSPIAAAKAHVGQPVVIAIDLKNFFPSVRSHQVRQALEGHGFPKDTADVICRLCTRQNQLPQGAPTSPVLARIVVSPALARIETAVQEISEHCRLTQWVDDLAISGPVGLKRAIGLISKIFRQCGFQVHPTKTRVMKCDAAQEVLGIRVNNRLEVGAEFRAKLEQARRDLPTDNRRLLGLQAYERAVSRAN